MPDRFDHDPVARLEAAKAAHRSMFTGEPRTTAFEVGWWGFDLSAPHTRIDTVWHPVATATVAEVEVEYLMPPDMGECRYHVTLTDVEAVDR